MRGKFQSVLLQLSNKNCSCTIIKGKINFHENPENNFINKNTETYA